MKLLKNNILNKNSIMKENIFKNFSKKCKKYNSGIRFKNLKVKIC